MKKEKLTSKDIDGNNFLFYEIINPYMKDSEHYLVIDKR